MILLLDIGNSRSKWRLWCEGWQQGGALDSTGESLLPQLSQVPEEIWIASVADEAFDASLAGACRSRWQRDPWFARSESATLGLKNSYRDPAPMGVDRWLAMLAGWHPGGRAVCVVDSGSALTIDLVAADGAHMGGYILPGLASMERALLSDTARVHFAEAARDLIDPGRSTAEAVYNGLMLSQAGAVALALERYGTGMSLVLSGGNGEALLRVLDSGGEYRPDLVFEGLLLAGQAR